jgi:uncharacterized protein YbjT (DUF2867 family)
VIACVRDRHRMSTYLGQPGIRIVELDLLKDTASQQLPLDFDVAYYLVHSMSTRVADFMALETKAAENFVAWLDRSTAKQVIYLSGLVNSTVLSNHLLSRKNVEAILYSSRVPVTTLRAGIIVGSGSASFEIIRDLVEKLPVMITPLWVKTRCQPIAIRNVLEYLSGVMGIEGTYNRSFDIGGPDIMTYKDMMMQFAEVRKLKRKIFIIPLMTPKISSYWLYFIASTSYYLAANLVDSMKVEVICENDDIREFVSHPLIPYKNAIELAFERIEQNLVLSSWKDAMVAGKKHMYIDNFIEVPVFGCYKDKKLVAAGNDTEHVIQNIWSIGGNRGWYYADNLWLFRGFLDRMAGGVGLRRGRTNAIALQAGDALDFWRVILADREKGRLLLYAEMKLPGEAWLEFSIIEKNHEKYLSQVATFRPKGVMGRLYWKLMLPFHSFIFRGMARNIVKFHGGVKQNL